ncbi:MAG: methylated-DNA--[protein]-cysteine S-methyltransferase [Ruminococcaceae bacterium]|nr:methylated-DNA--[protein]-cysteine S-methyltransferase [Oscillospiraceae bacterium]
MKYISTYASPIGKIILCSNGEFLTHLFFDGQKYSEVYLEGDATQKELPVFREASKWLDEYFCGRYPGFFSQIKLCGTPFQLSTWELLRKIPYGKTVTYGQLAHEICRQTGKEKMSAQAVGGAVGRNPISIIVPCHRVIGTDGSFTGYAGGTDKKQVLLKLEKII